ncbi:Ankyrin repeat [Arabidopsis thaliana x Arabidopsis arenosa]|uniref:Ankyrin repeat n=1 Tax=Arabidopsis thaliana x Arabidopsis arenosa TaxID=1240361 RepID=A0A8T2APJ7_9BRAS|nr:Ankyrin repeat [Arabidopsis thaliana x Arabidopsis arenosa]
MELSVSPQTQKMNLQTPRKSSLSGSRKDLWFAIREGSLVDVDSALSILKKNGGNINLRNVHGLTPLHIAVWRNHIPIIRRLLAAGADPDARDGESGWSSLHRALHFGHLAVASVLIDSGASFTLEDIKLRTPVDLVSGPVAQVIGEQQSSVATEVFSWGNGANYQLGTGNQHVQKVPGRVDSLHGCFIKLVSAAKFHSVAISSHGEVYTWGFGRGGRLGHPEFDIHSGQAAVITPRQVISGLGSRRVKAVAAAKHHTVIATEGGDVYTWGSNREGQLGYTSVDTQATPRKVTSLKAKIVAVSAANKHTAVVSECGEVFTWGCNKEGQLGYGTSNSASNYSPRLVDYLKGKLFTAIASSKYHTLVLRNDGEVYTWGHRLVTPRRIIISRNLKKAGNTLLNFHRRRPLRLTAIAAGMVHSLALAEDGALFYWVSSDSNLRCQQLHSLHGKTVVSISAGKYWASAVTSTGEVYMWDGKDGKDMPPSLSRLHNLKRATTVAVGETHLLVVGSLYHPAYAPTVLKKSQTVQADESREEENEELDEGFMFDDVESVNVLQSVQHDNPKERTVPSLKSLCEKVAAECIVEPRNAIQLLEIADSLGAEDLKKYCEDIVIRNLDFILTVSPQSIANTSPDVLANLEKLLDDRSSEAWSSRPLPTPTATFPVVIDSEEEESESDILRTRDNHVKPFSSIADGSTRMDSFLQPEDELTLRNSKEVRALRKKLQQIEILEAKQSRGQHLDGQQIAKLQKKLDIESSLVELGIPVEESPEAKSSTALPLDGKANKKGKKKKKGKQRFLQVETYPDFGEVKVEIDTMQDKEIEEISEAIKPKDGKTMLDMTMISGFPKESDFVSLSQKKDNPPNSPRSKKLATAANKKKNRKGGLSMFLTGALDDIPKPVVAPPPKPKIEGPVWGGAKVSKGLSSLRDIQDEQSKTQPHEPVRTTRSGDDSSGKTEGKILLSSFLTSKPIPMEPAKSLQQSDVEKGTPPWASSETPRNLSRPSLRDIQMQEVKKQQSLSHSPKTKTSGFTVAIGQGSPSDSPGTNRWFKPEIDAPSAIRSIQIEEKAMKDLRRFYSSVKVVRNQP